MMRKARGAGSAEWTALSQQAVCSTVPGAAVAADALPACSFVDTMMVGVSVTCANDVPHGNNTRLSIDKHPRRGP